MSALKSAEDLPKEGERLQSSRLGAIKGLSLAVGIGAVGLFFVLALVLPGDGEGRQFSWKGAMAYSWLFAVTFYLTLAIGGIFWTLLHHATNSGWGIVVRRLMENLGFVVILLMLLGSPMVLLKDFRNALWEWIPARAEMQIGAENYAKNQLDDERKKLEAKIAGAEEKLAKLEAETAKNLEKAMPGDAAFLKLKLEREKAEVEALKTVDPADEKALKKKLEKKFWKDGDGHDAHGNILLYKKRAYLNLGAWSFRFVLYTIALFGIIFVLRYWSIKQDSSGDPRYTRWMRRASCGFLPLYAAAWTFLVIDWLMGLDYAWFSTMWGVYLFAGSAVSSMGLLIGLLTLLRSEGALKEVVTLEHYHIMGKLMHAFVVFWAYIAFSQFFLIWYANITEETKFYLTRNTDYWNGLTIAFAVIGHFFVPFVILLVRQVKKTPLLVSGIGLWILAMHLFDIYFIIIPERGPSLTEGALMTIAPAILTDILAFIGVGGLFVWFLLRNLGDASLYPSRDPRLEESINLVN